MLRQGRHFGGGLSVVLVDLDDLGEALIFPLFVLDELQSLSLLAAQLRRLLLKLVSSCAFNLKNDNEGKKGKSSRFLFKIPWYFIGNITN